VIAFDIGSEFVGLCRDLTAKIRCRIIKSGLRDFISLRRYDRIFAGNVHHYLFKEASCTYAYLTKLSALTEDSGLLLIEGPLGMECRDMARVLPDPRQSACFSRQGFLHAASQADFEVLSVSPTTAFTPNRYIVALRRRPRLYHAYSRSNIDSVLRREPNKTLVVLEKDGFVTKVAPKRLSVSDQIAAELAARAPNSNGLMAWVTDADGVIRGWRERPVDSESLPLNVKEREVYKRYARDNVYLSRLGYVNPDPGVINWTSGELLCFDKNAVAPCSSMSLPVMRKHAQAYTHFNSLPESVVHGAIDALLTRNSVEVEKFFLEVQSCL
jgi:hypothetical protein